VCRKIAEELIKKDNDELQNYMNSAAYEEQVSPSHKTLFEVTAELYKSVSNDITNYLNGQNNNSLEKGFAKQLNSLKQAIIRNTRPQVRNYLIFLYKFACRLFYNILRCQDNTTLINNDVILLLNLIHSHFDPEIGNSFTNREIIINDNYKNFLEELFNSLEEDNILKNHLMLIIKVL
jgi:hypothetical protein